MAKDRYASRSVGKPTRGQPSWFNDHSEFLGMTKLEKVLTVEHYGEGRVDRTVADP